MSTHRLTAVLSVSRWPRPSSLRARPRRPHGALVDRSRPMRSPSRRRAAPPAPCDSVDLSGGEAARRRAPQGHQRRRADAGDSHPAARRASRTPPCSRPTRPTYFAAAWARARRASKRISDSPLPREAVGVTVNSMIRRSQDELHLHVDCLDKDVAAALGALRASLDDQWRPMTVALKGRHYWARRLESPISTDASPFRLLADGLPGAKEEMGLWSLAAVGATFSGQPGFVLLADHAELDGGRPCRRPAGSRLRRSRRSRNVNSRVCRSSPEKRLQRGWISPHLRYFGALFGRARGEWGDA